MKIKSELCVKKSIKVENKKFIIRIVFDEPTLRLGGGYDYSEYIIIIPVRIQENSDHIFLSRSYQVRGRDKKLNKGVIFWKISKK